MTGADAASEMFANMLLATGVLIGAVVVVVVTGFVIYYRTAEDGRKTEEGPRSQLGFEERSSP